jgi:hypothetical protein
VVLKLARPLVILAIVLLVLIAPKRINERAFAHELAAEKAITTVHTAETQSYSEHGRYAATLEQLGLNASVLTGGNATIVLRPTPVGYSVTASPTFPGRRVLYSDQSEPVLGEPVLGDPVPGR